jgi:hypothetical protein
LRFLRRIDQQTPADLDLHLIVDNYATHKTPAVKRWLKAHPRFHLHFTWSNASSPRSPENASDAARSTASQSSRAPSWNIWKTIMPTRTLFWTKSAGEILEKGTRAKQALESQH